MIEPTATQVPTFISSRSADVILSDIRPTKLTPDALNSINALLDELLYSILNAARSFNTSRLRTAMHKVLPTTLGKEAILEAEMELRAYYQRTVTAVGSSSSSEDGVFNLQWASELLRLKCEAYSTLSDTDENSDAENRLKERMLADGVPPPKQEVLSPASLYLTAIIESICEHILSNVGRVASRDSSRATAHSQDLFIALCEDSTIYGFFKNMKVYAQIETLSKLPKPRRSKSFTREKLSGATSPASSREGDAFRKDSSRHRMSSESSNIGPAVVGSNHPSARSSIDKARAIKIFSGNSNRGSNDHPNGTDSVIGHRKTDSLVSANAKQSFHSGDRSPISPTFSEDRSQEFDDMMRSGSTMKVSLTPDRLRTMEALNKEKARFNGRKTSLQSSHKDSISSEALLVPTAPDQPKRTTRPSLRHVDSIHEDDEIQPIAKPPPTSRPRQLSAATTPGFSPPSSTRARSASSADPTMLKPTTFPPPGPPQSSLGSSLKQPNLAPSKVQQKRTRPVPHGLDVNQSRPPRTRTVARNRESLDLDDIMGGSENEDEAEKLKSTPCYNPQRGISASARELIDFLAEGPPEPPTTSPTNINSGFLLTPKKTGRLQRMISKITLNGNEKVRSDNESGKSSPRRADAFTPLLPNKSLTNLSSLANRPVPPRYPTDLPSATSSESRSSVDNALSDHRVRKQSFSRKPVPALDPKTTSPDSLVPTSAPVMVVVDVSSPVPPMPTSVVLTTSKRVFEHDAVSKRGSDGSSSAVASVEAPARSSSESKAPTVQAPERSPSRVAISHLAKRPAQLSPATSSPSIPPSVIDHAHDMRRTLSHATSATECRLLIDIFLARAGLVADSSELQGLVSTPLTPESAAKESHMEHAIVELLLGGDEESSDPPVQSEP